MKAFLLAAGHGTRLHPITADLPKCLVPLRGTPLLAIWLENCERYGIDEVLINVHAHGDAVRQYIAQRSFGVRVRISEERTLLGSAGTLAENRDWIGDDPSFWVFYSDVLTNADLGKMQRFHDASDALATLGVSEVEDPRRCGIAVTDAQARIVRFVEKPADPPGNLAFSGLILANRQLLDEVPAERPVDIGFHLLPRLVGRMRAYRIAEYLLDVGTMENYQTAQKSWPGLAPKTEENAKRHHL
jgi:mannose-1-phosphate guanylyltransferase